MKFPLAAPIYISINCRIYHQATIQTPNPIESTPTTTPTTPPFENLPPEDFTPEVALAVLLVLVLIMVVRLLVTEVRLLNVGVVTIKVLGVGIPNDCPEVPVGEFG